MITLRKYLTDYLLMRRAMGFQLYRPGKALHKFVKFAEQKHSRVITVALALQWAKLPENAQPSTWALRLGWVRGFANYCHTIDTRNEVLPAGLLPYNCPRKQPYIYNQTEIQKMLNATENLNVFGMQPLRRHTYRTFFGLIAVTGMRISEARLLDDNDININKSLIIISNTKFGKSRMLPLHATTCTVLQRYRELRNRKFTQIHASAFFVNEQGMRLSESSIRSAFHQILQFSGIQTPPNGRRPRIHDLRHSFAVWTLRNWYRKNYNIQAWLPRLSTYLGHTHVNDTYWYLTAIPDLLSTAARRLDYIERRFYHETKS